MRDWFKFFPIVTFLAFLVKTIVIPASIPDAIILLGLISYIVADEFRLTNKKVAQFQAQLAQTMSTQTELLENFKKVQSSANAAKIAQGMRPVQQNQKSF